MNDDWIREAMHDRPLPRPPASGADLRQLAVRRRRRRNAAFGSSAGLALVGIGVVFGLTWQPAGTALTPRGAEAGPVLHLSWMVEGEQLDRTPHTRIAPHEQVIFVADSGEGGFLCLDESADGGGWVRVYPDAGGSWAIRPGQHMPSSGDQVQAYRTDGGTGVRTYRLAFDADDPACSHPDGVTEASLEWLP